MGLLYTCTHPEILNQEIKKTLESVTGVHLVGKNVSEVEALNVKDQELTELPPNMFMFFPDLKAILLINTGLRTISPDDLLFPKLEYFSSMNNKIHAIDGELFMNTPRLKTISFYKNSLDHIGENIFKGLELTHVDLRENVCVDAWSWTAEQLEELEQKIMNECKCSYRCSLSDEVDELSLLADEFSKKAKELVELNLKQDDVIAKIDTDNQEIMNKMNIFDEKLKQFEENFNELEQVYCEEGNINFKTTLRIILIVLISIFLLAVLLVVFIFSYRKCIAKTDKPASGNVHKLVFSKT